MALSNRVVAVAGAGVLAFAATLLPSSQLSQQIEQREGVRLHAYLDPVRIPTICAGLTKGVKLGQVETAQGCKERDYAALLEFSKGVGKVVTHPVSQGQFDALVSLAYNIGMGNFGISATLREVNAGYCARAADGFMSWTRARDPYGKLIVLPGLVTRRKDEMNQFRKDCKLWTLLP